MIEVITPLWIIHTERTDQNVCTPITNVEPQRRGIKVRVEITT